MLKNILFVILDQYADWEAAYLSAFINTLGQGVYAVKTVSLKNEGVLSCGGFTAMPDYSIKNCPENFEGLILVGGMSWRKEEALKVKPLVYKALENGKVVGGICDAAAFLGVIGALNTVRHTGNDLDDLKKWAGAAYTGEKLYLCQPAVCDQKIVTANGTATLEFAAETLKALDIASERKIQEWVAFYKLGPYGASIPKF